MIWFLKFARKNISCPGNHFPLESPAAYFSKSTFKLIPDWFISYTNEKSEVPSAKSLGFEIKLPYKSLI